MNFRKDGVYGIRFIAVDDIKKFILNEENPFHIRPCTIILRFEGRKIEFRKFELINMNSGVEGCGCCSCSTRMVECSCCFRHVDKVLGDC